MTIHSPPTPPPTDPPGISIHIEKKAWSHLKKSTDDESRIFQAEMRKTFPDSKAEAKWVMRVDFSIPNVLSGANKEVIAKLGSKLMVVRFPDGLTIVIAKAAVPMMVEVVQDIHKDKVRYQALSAVRKRADEARAQGRSPAEQQGAGILGLIDFAASLDEQITGDEEMPNITKEELIAVLQAHEENIAAKIAAAPANTPPAQQDLVLGNISIDAVDRFLNNQAIKGSLGTVIKDAMASDMASLKQDMKGLKGMIATLFVGLVVALVAFLLKH